MSALRLILASLLHHRRIHAAVALGVMACTTVVTGALLVGDSVRGSLRDLTLERLGSIDEVLVTPRFFRSELAGELGSSSSFQQHFATALPAILLRGTVENPDLGGRTGQVTILGSGPGFWELGQGGPATLPRFDEVVLNATLAAQLQAEVGKEVVVRLPQLSQIPADSPLGRKKETVRSRRLKVVDIIAAQNLGRFGLEPNQQLPHNAYVAIETLQDLLDQKDKANAILVSGRPDVEPSAAAHDELQEALKPSLADYGLTISYVRLADGNDVVLDYYNLTSDQMLIADEVQGTAHTVFGGGTQAAITYLANEIKHGDRSIPYSTITGIELGGPASPPMPSEAARLGDDEIVLNSWAADDLAAKPGDEIKVSFFEPESTHGEARERTETFRLVDVLPLAEPEQPPEWANDPGLTPELPGVTDQASIDDWDPPFPFEQDRVRDKDEKYWDDYRTTPKAFVSLKTGRRLWASRFGNSTSIRIPAKPGQTVESLSAELQLDPKRMGFEFLPVKQLGLMAAQGTTPFNLLFLGFSFFIMAAALMLVWLLFRLGLDQRAREVGILLAVGIGRRRARQLLMAEQLPVALVGGLLGVAAGVAYAWLMLAGLRTWWLSAVSTPFLQLHITASSLLVGLASGVLICLATIALGSRQMSSVSARRLLTGGAAEALGIVRTTGRKRLWIAIALLLAAAILGFAGSRAQAEMQALAFFGSGAAVLAAVMLLLWRGLQTGAFAHAGGIGRGSLAGLAAGNVGRNPSRSTITLGLVASASFLIIAISAFRLEPPSGEPRLDSGDGGFLLAAESSQPIYHNLNTEDGRAELGFDEQADGLMQKAQAIALRVQPGEDASCLNLYQPRQPRALGITPELIERGGFAWAGSSAETAEEQANPWLLLQTRAPADDAAPVPVVLDQNTAMYSLHTGLGKTFPLDDGHGGHFDALVVGLLKNSIFQGEVLMGEREFLKRFPQVSGYQYFLIAAPPEQAAEISTVLESTLGDYGFDAEPTRDKLASFFAVQNTYLATFQSLGGLGLLLGTFGLAVVQLRSVLERRGELALMRAAGFRRRRLAWLVMLENMLLLVGGLATGILAALVAILPHLFGGRAGLPWQSLALTLGLVLAVGLAAGTLAVRATSRAELLPALRGE